MSALATVARKSFNGIYSENWFSDRAFYVTIADAEIGSLKSLHTLFDSVWTTCWWNLNKIVWSEIYKILSFLAKNG